MCLHTKFKVEANVARIANSENEIATDYRCDITVMCEDCFKPFKFVGLPAGMSWDKPTVSIDALELRAPIKPII